MIQTHCSFRIVDRRRLFLSSTACPWLGGIANGFTKSGTSSSEPPSRSDPSRVHKVFATFAIEGFVLHPFQSTSLFPARVVQRAINSRACKMDLQPAESLFLWRISWNEVPLLYLFQTHLTHSPSPFYARQHLSKSEAAYNWRKSLTPALPSSLGMIIEAHAAPHCSPHTNL